MSHKEKIWIFGDSYGDTTCIKDKNSFSWVEELTNYYNVTNFCVRGSGANCTIANFNKQVDTYKNSLKDINLIFIIPSIYRLNFSFYKKEEDQVLTKFIVDNDRTSNDKVNKKIKFYTKKYREFVNNFFKYYVYHNYRSDTLLKIIGNVSLYSPLFSSVLCFVVDPAGLSTNINKLVNKDDFHFMDTCLSDISDAEMVGRVNIGEDGRNNHLNEHNNKVMYQQISKWLSHRILIDTSQFNG